jgi:hypothetical protein
MNEVDRATVRACLEQIELGMSDAREVDAWWMFLSEKNRDEWKGFQALVMACRKSLKP